jgi:hypothetical protein
VKFCLFLNCLGFSLLFFPGPCSPALAAENPQTAAESSDYRATSTHAQVLAFCKELAKKSKYVRLASLGTSHAGRQLPLLIIADPPVSTPEAAAKTGKVIVFAMANIHAGEVDGKEALLMLAREIALAKERPLLKNLILVFAPNFNADGNEKWGKHRPEQAGPEKVGTRANAQGFDLNRDYVKLESPEVRALVRFLNRWDPAVVIDCHTTNGSPHRYTLTYEGGRCPAGDAKLITHVRDEMLPDVSRRLRKSTGFHSFFYGNFSADRSRWETVSPLPRYGTHYVGLRNRIAILSESYSYAPFRDRVLASKAFVRSICENCAANQTKIRNVLDQARLATIAVGKNPGKKEQVALRHKAAAFGRPVSILGFIEEMKNGKRSVTKKPKIYDLDYYGAAVPTLTVQRPCAYLIPAQLKAVLANLDRHGIRMKKMTKDVDLEVEAYKVIKITRAASFQKHQPLTLEVVSQKEKHRVKAGTFLVPTAQPLGSLAVYLLEPQSSDGLATWNFFDEVIKEGKDFPVLRVPRPFVPKEEEKVDG